MIGAASVPLEAARVRWNWLWGARADLSWNVLPFWLGSAMIAVLYANRHLGGLNDNPTWNFDVAGVHVQLAAILLYLYGPLVDAPHLWATIARTYTDREEWRTRRSLFLGSLVWFLIGPAVIVLPYGLCAMGLLDLEQRASGWLIWSNFFTFYALFHINKQHWGFVALYRRKNKDLDALDQRVDPLFFYTAIWAPFAAMVTAPGYVDYDGKPIAFIAATGGVLHMLCHVTFFAACAAYILFQLVQWQRGVTRNGPKLVYLATVLPLYYVAFSLDPLIATLWVVTIGIGHCAQYHRIVWTYGTSKYAGKQGEQRSLPSKIFENLGLYAGLGLLFGIVTLQGFGNSMVTGPTVHVLEASVFARMFSYLSEHESLALSFKVVAAFVSGVRLHHFYVDSKIWRVSKTAGLAQNLDVAR